VYGILISSLLIVFITIFFNNINTTEILKIIDKIKKDFGKSNESSKIDEYSSKYSMEYFKILKLRKDLLEDIND